MADYKLVIGAPLVTPNPSASAPAVSVVIPMYDAGNYIGKCLESLLVQTFKDFEVIIVDDCSKDNSVQIVESYMPKFQNKLTLLHTEKNSGSAATPRNKGLYFSRGEYIFFSDSDDFLAKTALEEMYMLAKDFDADVVYCEKNFEMNDDGSNVRLVTHQKGKLVEKPTFASKNLGERVNNLLEQDIWGPPWCKLVRRDFLIENEITFPNVFPCEDYFWTLGLFFFAGNFLRVPSSTYFWRQTTKSSIRGKNTDAEKINLWLHPMILGLKYFDNVMNRLEFFRNNIEYRHAVLDFIVKKMSSMCFRDVMSIPQFMIYGSIKKEFAKDLGEYDVLVSALFTALNTQQKITVMNQRNFNKIISETNKKIAALEEELKQLA